MIALRDGPRVYAEPLGVRGAAVIFADFFLLFKLKVLIDYLIMSLVYTVSSWLSLLTNRYWMKERFSKIQNNFL